jgi:hypothetical protein
MSLCRNCGKPLILFNGKRIACDCFYRELKEALKEMVSEKIESEEEDERYTP